MLGAAFCALVVTGGTGRAAETAKTVETSPVPVSRPYELKMPELRWKSQRNGPAWTRATMGAVKSHGSRLLSTIPRDIDSWCPGYRDQTLQGRAAFWAGLLSTLSYHESTWRETAVGGGGAWVGLVQISPPTARAYGCEAQSASALKDGRKNLACAVRIMARTVARDQVVSAGMRGVAADWGPFHSQDKRADMQGWIAKQPFCKLEIRRSPLPVYRPEKDGPPAPPPTLLAANDIYMEYMEAALSLAPDLPSALAPRSVSRTR